MKSLVKIKNNILLNRSSPIFMVAGEPNTKKTFFGVYFAEVSPLIYVDFRLKDLSQKEGIFRERGINVMAVPPERTDIPTVMEMIYELPRGTVILDGFSSLPYSDQNNLADAVLNKMSSNYFNIIADVYSKKDGSEVDRKVSVTLPTRFVPMDKRLIDFLFVREDGLTMLGRSEVKWQWSKHPG